MYSGLPRKNRGGTVRVENVLPELTTAGEEDVGIRHKNCADSCYRDRDPDGRAAIQRTDIHRTILVYLGRVFDRQVCFQGGERVDGQVVESDLRLFTIVRTA